LKTVCIQGLGFVGAAMAVAVASARDPESSPRYKVIGVDLNTDAGVERVMALNTGTFPFPTSDRALIDATQRAYETGNLHATTDERVYSSANIIIVDVALDIPFQVDEPKFDLSGFKSAVRTIAEHVSPGTLVLIETTVPPGTCEKVVAPILYEGASRRGIDRRSIHLAHSYERVMPGENYLESITAFWRVYAGATKEAADECEKFLGTIIDVDSFPMSRLSSLRASESAKLLENTYRAVNIAFIDEWNKYAEAVDVDLYEIIDAIKVRPTHSNIRYPGLGVGGYCLTKDPAFVPAAVRQFFDNRNLTFPFSQLALKTNQAMPEYVVGQLKRIMGGQLSEKRVLILGVSYREDVGDTRFSAVETFARSLIEEGAYVTPYDPYLNYWPELKLTLPVEMPDPSEFDSIVLCVRHKEFMVEEFFRLLEQARLTIFDAANLLDSQKRAGYRAKGINIASLGRGISF